MGCMAGSVYFLEIKLTTYSTEWLKRRMFCCIVRVHQDCCVLSYDPRHWQKRTYSWRGFYCYFSALYPFVSLATYVALTANCKQFGNRIASSFQGAFDGKIKKGTKYHCQCCHLLGPIYICPHINETNCFDYATLHGSSWPTKTSRYSASVQ
jgi:hypothetical protein